VVLQDHGQFLPWVMGRFDRSGTKGLSVMKIQNLKIWSFLFLLVGVGNFLMLVDILLSDGEDSYSLLSITTSKAINASFYALMSCFLIFAGIYQHRRLNNQKKEN
jgi:predicted transporter